MIALHHGDCREIIPTLGVTVDAVVTDPPYNLEAMAKRFAPGQKAATSPDHQRFAKGFMGMTWDSDVAFQPETWVTIGNVLRPGGFLVAFGGTRTYHRMTCAIEDAGFVVQDCLMFMFATGFPKRGDMLKPAYEPIVLAYKPGGKRTLQVDECRVPTEGETFVAPQSNPANRRGIVGIAMQATGGAERNQAAQRESIERTRTLGRWPANICHDGSDEVVALFPSSAGQQGDVRGTEPATTGESGIYGNFGRVPFNKRNGEASAERRYSDESGFAMLPGERRHDAGSAARFFFSAKAGTQDRWGSRHPTVKPVGLMKWLVALVTPPTGTVLDPFAGSGTTAVAALATGRSAILIEREDSYIVDIRERLAFYEGGGTHSVQAKNRNRKVDHGPLFEEKPTSTNSLKMAEILRPVTHIPTVVNERPYDPELDALESYNHAIQAIGERVKAGEPPPTTGYFGPGQLFREGR